MLTKKQTRTNLLKLRRLANRYYFQIRIGLGVVGFILLILILKALLPWLIYGGQLTLGAFSGGVSLISQSTEDLQGGNERVNLLLLGVGGGEKNAGDLTDTIIFVSVDPKTGNTLMLSLPRDIWLASMRAKLNTAYHYGNEKKSGGGLILAKTSVSEILDQPVGYGVVIDFTGFEQIIDILGGVTVDVKNSFDDYYYPIPGKENDECEGDPEYLCRYEHLHFNAGKQEISGELALKYARSRYAEGEEGTDFDRNQRQQQLLVAIKNKVFSFRVLANPFKVVQLFKALKQNFETDIPQKDLGGMVKLILKMRSGDLKSEVLNGDAEGKEGYLITPPPDPRKYDNHWILIPRTGNWQEIQEYLEELLSQK